MWLTVVVLMVVAAGTVAAAAVLYGRHRWEAAGADLRARLEESRTPPSPATYSSAELDGLPPPVRRYVRTVLEEGQPMVASARITHRGEFNLDGSGERWVRFRSDQWSVTRRPGFVWDARMRVAPGVSVFVHDAYVAGRGVLRARLLGLVPVMEPPATPELAHGELMRFFAEAAWYPTALLPSQGVRWEGIDERSASATLSDGETSVTLTFEFDDQGLIVRVRSDGRYREVDGTTVAVPWQGRFWNYERHGGMLIPVDGEVSWVLPDGPAPYWRGTIEEITFRTTSPAAPT